MPVHGCASQPHQSLLTGTPPPPYMRSAVWVLQADGRTDCKVRAGRERDVQQQGLQCGGYTTATWCSMLH